MYWKKSQLFSIGIVVPVKIFMLGLAIFRIFGRTLGRIGTSADKTCLKK